MNYSREDPTKNVRSKAFPVRIVTIWNNLPSHVVEAPSLNSFKNRLDNAWKNQEVLYDFKAPLRITRRAEKGTPEEDDVVIEVAC